MSIFVHFKRLCHEATRYKDTVIQVVFVDCSNRVRPTESDRDRPHAHTHARTHVRMVGLGLELLFPSFAPPLLAKLLCFWRISQFQRLIEANIMSSNIDLYRDIHKGQRRRFSDIATEAGNLDYTDPKALDALYDELFSFREHMRLHAHLEETFIHTILSQRVPGSARQLEEDHRVIHQEFDDLITHFEGMRAKLTDFEKLGELALEFYRAWNRFIAFYFMHINREEEQIMPALWKLCTVKELAETHKLMITTQKQKELIEDFEMILPNANPQERIEILGTLRVLTSPEAYQTFLNLAEHLLEPNAWASLKTELGLS